MKNRFLFLITALTILLGSNCFAQIQTIEWQGRQRQYLVKTPENYESLPVLFFLHGLGDNITHVNSEHNFQQVANRYNWMVVIPQAVDEGGGSMWNAALMNSTIDDSGFLMALLDSLAVQYPINQDSVFFTGFSMGGRESLLIGLQRPDLFGYVGAICPAPGVTGSFSWKSGEEPHLLFITAGSNDQTVYNIPSGYNDSFTKNGVPHIWHYVEGGYHGDNSIHAHLYNFVRTLFKA